MMITEIVPRGKLKMTVRTDGDLSFTLYKKELSRYSLREGDALSEDFLRDTLFPLLKNRAYSRSIHLLAARDYTEANLRRKLSEGGIPEPCLSETLDRLKSLHYLDDRRYAESFLRSCSRDRSRLQLLQGLLSRGVERSLAEELLSSGVSGADEEAQAFRLLQKRHYDPETADRKEKQRHAAFLARRGYSWSLISRCLAVEEAF